MEEGINFYVKGCDPRGGCETLEIYVHVNDIAEINTISGSPTITGQYILAGVLYG